MNGHPVNGAALRRARQDARVPLVVVARRLYMTAGHLRSIENGRRTARQEIITAYARVLAERGATLPASVPARRKRFPEDDAAETIMRAIAAAHQSGSRTDLINRDDGMLGPPTRHPWS